MVVAVSNKSRLNEYHSTYVTPGRSNTNCSGSGTTIGDTTSVSASCQTTSTPAQQQEIVTRTLDVVNVVDGEGMRYVIYCRASWVGSNCAPLVEGDAFEAEIDKKTMWLVARKGGNQGKQIRMKNKILDVRPTQTPVENTALRQSSASAEYLPRTGDDGPAYRGQSQQPIAPPISTPPAQPNRIWSNGTVLDRGTTRTLLSLKLASVPAVAHPENAFAVRSDRFVFILEVPNVEQGVFQTKDPEILFLVDGETLVMLGDDEKEHKFQIIGRLERSQP